MADILLAFKAGRAFRRDNTSNIVEPSPVKGAIILTAGDDGLFHFTWKNRTSGVVDEDLILFPSDASFVKVPHPTGRVYVLKFSSSNQRHFFWLQDASTARDEEFVANINRLLEDPESNLVWNTASSAASQPQASTSAASLSATAPLIPPEQLAQLQALLAGSSSTPAAPEFSLTDILTPANLTPLFTSHPELIPTLFPHLPPDLPTPPSAEALQRIINSPQFRSAVSSFDQALRTGLLGGLVRGLGLPEEAGTGIEPFLRAVQEQANKDTPPGGADDHMETD
ncbi:proteasome complex subunit Rpn13 ubiquitin receptor-domain-containing protein [Mycena rosella]|uniref:Proteasome complex subunit Rpn13 ubiquitin receptor-domain-containing protein n=1 Tax=Mycena rosella TaxID=1033263 RepID=A0AAD7GI43_MYCRO|nr:proteasome complex subunit Rpn13 ubiquitin receptor-domain-containing protein [Mycena rosella]